MRKKSLADWLRQRSSSPLLLAGFLGGALTLGSAATAAELKGWQYDSSSSALTFILPDGVQPRYFLMAQPARIVLDIPEAQLGQVPPEQTYGGAVKKITIQQLQPKLLRVILEMSPDAVFARGQAKLEHVGNLDNPTPGTDRWILRPLLAGTIPDRPIAATPNRSAQTPALPAANATASTPRPTPAPITPPRPDEYPPGMTLPADGPAQITPNQSPDALFKAKVTTTNAAIALPALPTAPVKAAPLGPPKINTAMTKPAAIAQVAPVVPPAAPTLITPVLPALPPPPSSTAQPRFELPKSTAALPPSGQPQVSVPPLASVTVGNGVTAGMTAGNGGNGQWSMLNQRPSSTVGLPPSVKLPPSMISSNSPGLSGLPTQPATPVPPVDRRSSAAAMPPLPPGLNSAPFNNAPLSIAYNNSSAYNAGLPNATQASFPPQPSTWTSSAVAPSLLTATPLPLVGTPPGQIDFGQPLPGPVLSSGLSNGPITGPVGVGGNISSTIGVTALDNITTGGLIVPAGTTLNLRYASSQPLQLRPGQTQQELLLLQTPIRDNTGRILAPSGSSVLGQFETTPNGSRFITQAISLQGRSVPLSAASDVFSGQRQLSADRMLKNSGIGAVAGAILGGLSGGGLLGGAAAGAAITYAVAPKQTSIQPGQTLDIRLLQDLTTTR